MQDPSGLADEIAQLNIGSHHLSANRDFELDRKLRERTSRPFGEIGGIRLGSVSHAPQRCLMAPIPLRDASGSSVRTVRSLASLGLRHKPPRKVRSLAAKPQNREMSAPARTSALCPPLYRCLAVSLSRPLRHHPALPQVVQQQRIYRRIALQRQQRDLTPRTELAQLIAVRGQVRFVSLEQRRGDRHFR